MDRQADYTYGPRFLGIKILTDTLPVRHKIEANAAHGEGKGGRRRGVESGGFAVFDSISNTRETVGCLPGWL